MPAPALSSRIAFGLYEVDLKSEELWKAGFRVKLQSQPFKVLVALLEHPGEIVTREDLRHLLWGNDTVGNFEQNLGAAINKIREALGDSAENPRFVETLSRRGYRFIAPVTFEPAHPPATAAAGVIAPDVPHAEPAPGPAFAPIASSERAAPALPRNGMAAASDVPVHRRLARWAIFAALLVLAAAGGVYYGSTRAGTVPVHIAQVTSSGQLTGNLNIAANLGALVTDGVHLFASTLDHGQHGISIISLPSGSMTPLLIPSEVASPSMGDISPDGSNLLLRDHLSPEAEQPLWVVPTTGGSAQRVGNVLAHDATWMPDGKGILFASGNRLYLTQLISNQPQEYATLPGPAFWLRWEPNGHWLRFTIVDPIRHTRSLWQLNPADRKPEPILVDRKGPSDICCGVWTADGRSYVFQSSEGGNYDLWRTHGEAASGASRLTDGPLQFESPVAAHTGNRIYFVGVAANSELQRIMPGGKTIAETGFLASAFRVNYSRDGQWVVWTNSSGELWRAHADGTEKLQLTPAGMDVFLAQWSPDGSRLAIMAREPGKAWQIYLLNADGGAPQLLLREQRNAADPSWSADGQSLVFGRINDDMGKENADRALYILHLGSHQVEQVPGSEGLFSPRWSPDGQYIAALSLDQRQVRLYTVATRTWTTLAVPSGADPVWSSDSRYLYVHARLDPAQPIDRVSLPSGKVDEMVRLAESSGGNALEFIFSGITPDQSLLVRSRNSTGNIYALDLR